MSVRRAVVVGAGFGGLTSALLLAKKGFEVTIVEKNSEAGGRARVWKEKGFTFDMGPSWYLMPEVFENFFEALGRKRTDYYQLRRLNPGYRVYFGRAKRSKLRPMLVRLWHFLSRSRQVVVLGFENTSMLPDTNTK